MLRARRLPGLPALSLFVAVFAAIGPADDAHASDDGKRLNGFDLAGASIPIDEIVRGGPPRDGIAALDSPPVVAATAAPWRDEEHVIGVVRGSAARAYPLAILVWHELVNDRLGDLPLLVSYCPLCGTGLVFDRRVGSREMTFGVSGLLYQSDLLMFDRQTEGLWSQIAAKSVTGPLRDRRLALIRSRITSWGDWKKRHPDTTVLSKDTGHRRDYGRTPYRGYATSETLAFPAPLDDRYHPKMPTLGVRIADGAARAYPAVEIERSGGIVEERFAGHPVVVRYDAETELFDVDAPPGIDVIEGFWFAWAAFHPRTSVFQATPEPRAD